MVNKGLLFILGCLAITALHATQVSVFISFSMPQLLLEETLKESSERRIPVYLRGLYKDSMKETAAKVMALSKKIPMLNLQIDPTLFERFGIEQVPALVLDNGKAFDVIYGHLTIKEGLARMAGHGDVTLSPQAARRLAND
ncbi:conjugal transfer pilus assembly protein TrbC [Legionella massiliensis]|uniref:Conjugal transfer pilus assembly protein TrbC n=1 Tax=Legionella massiliensis TaxID=1034943 RepID=A0A078L678_9GAMM|nr:type-F conjugative transfer system pilin assembly protein TrbC [Legionella massiliensis]CDZ79408.1 conjugal transfer pilus assembly protein TrbC [Legionella massiliensis]CEE15146.1 Type-F conjugative transfer system pilin assembly protein [Legionella massiliensis]